MKVRFLPPQQMPENKDTDSWWKTVFDQKYLDTYLTDLTPELTSQEVDFVVKAVGLTPQDRILDLACGHGRHSVELAKRGFTVVGLDYSIPFIERANADATKTGVKIEFIQGDMKALPFKQTFDVVLMLFTSFGYFSNEENQGVFNQINKSLKPNGRFLLDVISGEAVVKRFNKEGVKEKGTNLLKIPRVFQMGALSIDEVEWYDPHEQLIHGHREWMDNDEKKEYEYYLRVYTIPQYKDMLSRAGFKFQNLWGDFLGNPHDTGGNFRTIILAKKDSTG